jgi:hypothetical protein
MEDAPEPPFSALLAALDGSELTAFVAAVYDARGWETDRTDGVVLATPPGANEPRRIVVDGAGPADRVVDVSDDGESTRDGATVVDAHDLWEQLRYALDADEAAALCRRFFDRDLAAIDGPGDASGGTAGAEASDDSAAREARDDRAHGVGRASTTTRQDGRRGAPPAGGETTATRESDDGGDRPGGRGWSPDSLRWLVAGLALLIVGGAVVGGAVVAGGWSLGGDAGTTGPAADATATPDGTRSPSATATEASPATSSGAPAAGEASGFPPGVDEDGIADVERLATAHRTALSGRSYQIRISRREYEGDVLRGVVHEHVVVASPDRYRSRVWRLGALEHRSFLIASGSSYANGSRRYVRTVSNDRTRNASERTVILVSRTADSDRFADRTSRAVQWYLDAEESSIVGTTERNGTRLFRVRFEGDAWPPATNVSGEALIDERGVVRVLQREHVPDADRDDRVDTTVWIEPGPVTVTRPEWLPENGSAVDSLDPGDDLAAAGRERRAAAGHR